MKEMESNGTRRGYTLIKYVGIMILLLVMLSSSANAVDWRDRFVNLHI